MRQQIKIFFALVGIIGVSMFVWGVVGNSKELARIAAIPTPKPTMSAPANWSLVHGVYSVNYASDYVPVDERVLFDKGAREVRLNINETYIENLDEVAADLPNVVPQGTFEGKLLECEHSVELSSSFYEVFNCHKVAEVSQP